MTHPKASTPEEIKAVVDNVDVTPAYFTREDGTPMVVVHAGFMDQVMAVYQEHNTVDIDYDNPIFKLPSQQYTPDDDATD
jgi:hypothetical protein